MAHLQGTDYVGSMVVLEDGLPNKREYRRFKVNVPGNDDYAAMREVLTRRLQAYLAARRETPQPGQRPAKFSYPPQLLLVDGGKGQLGVAEQVVDELGLTDEIPVAGLAKRFEQVFVPGRSAPVDIPRGSEALFMLQRIRDEAHRFANTFHAERRSKRMTRSSLDGIPGLGETRRKRLVKELGGVNAVKQASLEQLQALPMAAQQGRPPAVFERFRSECSCMEFGAGLHALHSEPGRGTGSGDAELLVEDQHRGAEQGVIFAEVARPQLDRSSEVVEGALADRIPGRSAERLTEHLVAPAQHDGVNVEGADEVGEGSAELATGAGDDRPIEAPTVASLREWCCDDSFEAARLPHAHRAPRGLTTT